MPNITFDFSNEPILNPNGSNVKNYVYRDIGTENFIYKVDSLTKQEYIDAVDSSNVNAAAVRASLKNILNFKSGEAILDPEFGIGPVYEMLYTPFDKHTAQKMIKTLKGIIATYEPRISITSVPTTYDADKHEFRITINYYIPEINENDSYQLILNQ